PAKRCASRGKAEVTLRVVSPEAALDAPCPGYWPADDGEPVARLSVARAGEKRRLHYASNPGGGA
ncbi:hypothetical protein, partial [Klebsiella pasteurii]|uniref:hypothetical protein n=1 Tax=Klebsiella pasteurii TaxID=2587529 RepID=UPI00254A7770